MESLSEKGVTPRLLADIKHTFYIRITSKTKLYVVGPHTKMVKHQCTPTKPEAFIAPEQPAHYAKPLAYCGDCDTLYAFCDVPDWTLLLGRKVPV